MSNEVLEVKNLVCPAKTPKWAGRKLYYKIEYHMYLKLRIIVACGELYHTLRLKRARWEAKSYRGTDERGPYRWAGRRKAVYNKETRVRGKLEDAPEPMRLYNSASLHMWEGIHIGPEYARWLADYRHPRLSQCNGLHVEHEKQIRMMFAHLEVSGPIPLIVTVFPNGAISRMWTKLVQLQE